MVKYNNRVPKFGQKRKGHTYHVRPGAYAIIFDAQDCVALIQVGQSFFLPGGGIEVGETPQVALQREVNEECGYELVIGEALGTAVEYICARSEAKYYEIRGSFWQARLGEKVAGTSEADHRLVWRDVSTAHTLLQRDSQKWALQKACDISGIAL